VARSVMMVVCFCSCVPNVDQIFPAVVENDDQRSTDDVIKINFRFPFRSCAHL